jgi:hypothetical protein
VRRAETTSSRVNRLLEAKTEVSHIYDARRLYAPPEVRTLIGSFHTDGGFV